MNLPAWDNSLWQWVLVIGYGGIALVAIGVLLVGLTGRRNE